MLAQLVILGDSMAGDAAAGDGVGAGIEFMHDNVDQSETRVIDLLTSRGGINLYFVGFVES